MSWLDELRARDPGAYDAMGEAGRVPHAANANDVTCRACRGTGWSQGGGASGSAPDAIDEAFPDYSDEDREQVRAFLEVVALERRFVCHEQCADDNGHVDGCVVQEDE